MAVTYPVTISNNTINTNFKPRVCVSASGTINNIYPIAEGYELEVSAASGATVVLDKDAGNVKMTSDFTATQGDLVKLRVYDISGTLYWLPTGGRANNA